MLALQNHLPRSFNARWDDSACVFALNHGHRLVHFLGDSLKAPDALLELVDSAALLLKLFRAVKRRLLSRLLEREIQLSQHLHDPSFDDRIIDGGFLFDHVLLIM